MTARMPTSRYRRRAMRTLTNTLVSLLVPGDRGQRIRMRVWGASVVGYLLYSGVQTVEVTLGLLDRGVSDALIAAMALKSLVFYGIYRSGINKRVGWDNRLTVLQIGLGCVLSVRSYAVTGPARGAILMVLSSALMYSMFALAPRQARALAAGALAALGAVMVLRTQWGTPLYPWQLELVHFLFAAIGVWTVAALAGQVGAMQAKLGRQAQELKEAMARLSLVATRDELTRLHNRRHLTELIAIEARQHERTSSTMCIALLDIDLFKSINDRYGHAAGDLVLQRFAAVAQEALRGSDLIGRWGGEEFLVLLPDTSLAEAEIALQRLHQRLAEETIEAIGGQRVTFSGGLTAWLPGEALEATTERADQAMYAAKTDGRNRTTLRPPPAAERAPQEATVLASGGSPQAQAPAAGCAVPNEGH